MLKSTIIDALNGQINMELGSSYLYLALSARLEELSFPGAAHWLIVQSQEELNHVMMMMRFLLDRSAVVKFSPVTFVAPEIESVKCAFDAVCKHEAKISAAINQLAGLAHKEQDFMFMNFLQFFLNEQVEEEATCQLIFNRLRIAGDSAEAILQLDAELALRPAAVFNPTGSLKIAQAAL